MHVCHVLCSVAITQYQIRTPGRPGQHIERVPGRIPKLTLIGHLTAISMMRTALCRTRIIMG